MLEILLLTITITYLVIASISDLKTKEVPDFISYSLIIIALTLRLLYSLTTKDFTYLIQGLIGFAIFVALAFLFYYTKIWGGGDAKLLMWLGAVFPTYPKILLNYFTPNLNLPFLLILIMNILIIGSVYGILWSIILTTMNKKQVLKEIKPIYVKYRLLTHLFLILSILILSSILIIPETKIKLMMLALSIIILIYPYLIIFTKTIEESCLIKNTDIENLTEGDWLAKDVKVNNKVILSKKITEIEKKHIQLLKKYKIKKVLIKHGIPFIPSFLLSVIISLILGSLI